MEFSRRLNPLILAATALGTALEASETYAFESLSAPAIVAGVDGGVDTNSALPMLFSGGRELHGKTSNVEIMSGNGGKSGWSKEQFESFFSSVDKPRSVDASEVSALKSNFEGLLRGAPCADARRGCASIEEKSASANLLLQSMVWEGFSSDEIKAAFEYVDQLSGFNVKYANGTSADSRNGLSGMIGRTRTEVLKGIKERCINQGCQENFEKLSASSKDVLAFEELFTRARQEVSKASPKGTSSTQYIGNLIAKTAQLERKIAESAGTTEFEEAEDSEGELVMAATATLASRDTALSALITRIRELTAAPARH